MSVNGLYFEFPNVNKNTVRNYQKQFRDQYGQYYLIVKDLRVMVDVMKYKMKQNAKLSKEEYKSLDAIDNFLEGLEGK